MLSVSLTHAKINKTIEYPKRVVCIYSFLKDLLILIIAKKIV